MILAPEFAQVARRILLRPPPEFSPEELATLEAFVRASGMKPEGPGGPSFSLEGRPYLVPLYAERRDRPFRRLVIMKAAQMGLTVKLLYRAAWWAADGRQRINVALMFPTLEAVLDLQKSRFRPMFRSSSRLMRMVGDVDAASLVRVGVSTLRFRGMRSGIHVDSFPADVLLFDEVRLMDLATIERTFVRVSESRLEDPETGIRGIIELNSTAGFPDMDIDRWFQRSTMNYWHTPCPNPACKLHREGIPMPLRWPEVVGRDGDRLYYRCPECKTEIPDEVLTRVGWYVPRNPGAEWEGYQFSQILKGTRYLPELWAAWVRGDNLAEFYNSRLGLPYRDPDAVVASREVVEACIDPAYRYPRPEEIAGEWVSMGVDQRGPEKHVVIYKLGPGNTFDLVHLEVVEASGKAAVDALEAIARRWRAKIVVIDAEPSYDLAVDLARRLPPRTVYLADYAESPHAIRFTDERTKKDLKRATGEVKYEHRALLDRYKAIDWALKQFAHRRIRLPGDFYALEQPRTIAGLKQRWNVAREYVKHLENIARATIPVMTTLPTGEKVFSGEVRQIWRHLALDPHFAHAHTYALAGLARRAPGGEIAMGGEGREEIPVEEASLPPELRPSAIARQQQEAMRRTCGGCRYYSALDPESGLCTHPSNAGRSVRVGYDSPGCGFWRRRG